MIPQELRETIVRNQNFVYAIQSAGIRYEIFKTNLTNLARFEDSPIKLCVILSFPLRLNF